MHSWSSHGLIESGKSIMGKFPCFKHFHIFPTLIFSHVQIWPHAEWARCAFRVATWIKSIFTIHIIISIKDAWSIIRTASINKIPKMPLLPSQLNFTSIYFGMPYVSWYMKNSICWDFSTSFSLYRRCLLHAMLSDLQVICAILNWALAQPPAQLWVPEIYVWNYGFDLNGYDALS